MIEYFRKFFALGFFPEELPPEFGPYGITDHIAHDIWNRIDELRPIDGIPSASTKISFPKSEFVRREFHYLNPLYFARISHTILSNWEEIVTHTNVSTISTSRLTLSESDFLIFENDPFSTSINERLKRSASKEYVLYLDIENFYSSIYTHTIDRALNNGETRPHTEFGNRDHLGVALDIDLRRAQSNETNGIAIGPVTSRVISEIITCYFDKILADQFNNLKGTRYVDDYHLFLDSREEIDQVQTVLQKVLSEFKLKFNEAKIHTDKLPEVYSDFWTTFFEKTESLLDDDIGDKKELTRRFSKAFQLIKETSDNPSLRYFFRVLEDDKILAKFEIETVVNLISHSLRIDPRSISRACITLAKSELVNEELRDSLECLESQLLRKSDLGHDFEVLWILYLFLHSRRQIPEKVVKNIIQNGDVCCLCYLFLCWKHEIVSDELIADAKKILISKVEEYSSIWLSPLWLIAYEDKRQGWEIFTDIETPPGFEILLERGIEFMKSEPNNNPDDIILSRYDRIPDASEDEIFEVDDVESPEIDLTELDDEE